MYSEKHFSSKIMLKMWLVPDLPLFFKKDSCEVKASSQHLDTWTLGQLDWAYHKSKICNISECWSSDIRVCDVTHFETLVFSSSHFLHNQKKSGQKFKYFKKKKRHFNRKQNTFFVIFKGLFIEANKSNFFGIWEFIFKDELFNQWSIIVN